MLAALLLAGTSTALAAKPCTAHQLTLTFPSQPGEFTGMSHDGTWMVLRNTGPHTCSVPRRPALTMNDSAGKPLPIRLNTPPGMHPGPVLVPVQLAPGNAARAKLRWVMGEVYDNSTCADTATVSFQAPGGTVEATIKAHMCGERNNGVHYDQEWLQTK